MPEKIDYFDILVADSKHPRRSDTSIIQLKDKSLMLAWNEISTSGFGAQDAAPASTASMKSYDGGKTWGKYRILVERNPEDAHVYNVTLLNLQNGNILLSYTRNHHYLEGEPFSASGFIQISSDQGKTFGEPKPVWTKSNIGTNPDSTVQLSTGRIIFPALRLGGNVCEDDRIQVLLFYSDDNGETWSTSEGNFVLPLRGSGEPTIAELSNGSLFMTMRNQLGSVFYSRSFDHGLTWSKPQTTGLKCPESFPRLAKIPQTDHLVLVWNHSDYWPGYDHFGMRTPLSITLSTDGGETWGKIKNIEGDKTFEFTNPSVDFIDDKILITYMVSKYAKTAFPGKLGREYLSTRAAFVKLEWIYE